MTTTRHPPAENDLSDLATATAGPRRRRRGKLVTLYRLARALCVIVALTATTWIGASLLGALVASPWWRAAIPLSVAFILPWGVRFAVRWRLRRRYQRKLSLGGWWLYVGYNGALLALLCLGFGTVTGRALRRRGDGWMGEASGPIASALRRQIAHAASYMERFDVPAELGGAAGSGSGSASGPDVIADGPRPRPPAVGAKTASWVHPLPGRRRLPPNASCRFGARRPGDRPRECQLGHCGVDLAGPVGLPVVAIADGVVKSVWRDAERGGISGRYVILLHRERTVKSKYIHLDGIRAGLKPGDPIKAGERIGTLGRTGIKRSAPHLHFALSIRRGGGFHYIDPEPLLYTWALVQPKRSDQSVAAWQLTGPGGGSYDSAAGGGQAHATAAAAGRWGRGDTTSGVRGGLAVLSRDVARRLAHLRVDHPGAAAAAARPNLLRLSVVPHRRYHRGPR